jgi:hypothetical protein
VLTLLSRMKIEFEVQLKVKGFSTPLALQHSICQHHIIPVAVATGSGRRDSRSGAHRGAALVLSIVCAMP